MIYAAGIYCGLILISVGFQICLAAGAPWGHLANGGRWPGRFSPALRLGALGQGAILAFMGLAMAHRGGILHPEATGWPAGSWTFWAALGMTLMTTLANLATPSVPERRLWGPLTLALSVCALILIWA